MIYTPDAWVILKVDNFYKVLAGWSGGYLDGDSWRINSGIVKCQQHKDHFLFLGSSESVYQCHKQMYGLNMSIAHVYERLTKLGSVAVMPATTDWLTVNWNLPITD
jgi:hypothetical protein